MDSPQRSRFLKTATAGAILGPTGLIMNRRISADESPYGSGSFPNIDRVEVVRPDGVSAF